MTALCPGGGASAPQSGAAAIVEITSGFAALALDLYGSIWLKLLIPFMTLPHLTLSAFCSTDPPAIPTFTTAEGDALTNLTFGADFASGISKLEDLVQHLAWLKMCYCTGGVAQPTYPTAPAPPTGVAAPPPAITAGPCLTEHSVNLHSLGGVNGETSVWRHTGAGFPPDLNVTAVRFTITGTITAGAGQAVNVTIGMEDITGTNTTTQVVSAPGNGTVVFVMPAASTDAGAVAQGFGATGTSANRSDFAVTWESFCGVQPGAVSNPCCAPDAQLEGQVAAILQMVTLIQRQISPFAYVASTAHSGLTGAGSFGVAGLLGLAVTITTDSASLGSEGTSPAELFSRGFVTFATADGAMHSERIEHASEVLLPPCAGLYTTVYYDLNPLITATITELVRES